MKGTDFWNMHIVGFDGKKGKCSNCKSGEFTVNPDGRWRCSHCNIEGEDIEDFIDFFGGELRLRRLKENVWQEMCRVYLEDQGVEPGEVFQKLTALEDDKVRVKNYLLDKVEFTDNKKEEGGFVFSDMEELIKELVHKMSLDSDRVRFILNGMGKVGQIWLKPKPKPLEPIEGLSENPPIDERPVLMIELPLLGRE